MARARLLVFDDFIAIFFTIPAAACAVSLNLSMGTLLVLQAGFFTLAGTALVLEPVLLRFVFIKLQKTFGLTTLWALFHGNQTSIKPPMFP
jgi:hypothetical protein